MTHHRFMRSRLLAALGVFTLAVALVAVAAPRTTFAAVNVGLGGGTPGTSANFTLVGHDPLFNRGMNAALAIFGHYVYVGNRTDGSTTCEDGTLAARIRTLAC
jgi:hypothetical protein